MQVARERRKNEQREITLSKALNWALSICKPLMRHVLSICKPVWGAISSIRKPAPALPSRLFAHAKIRRRFFDSSWGWRTPKAGSAFAEEDAGGQIPRRVACAAVEQGWAARAGSPLDSAASLGRVKSTFACRSPAGSIRAPGCGVRAGARSKRAQPAAVHAWRAARHPFELALLPLYKTQRPTLRYALSMGGRRTRARFRIIEAQAKTVGI